MSRVKSSTYNLNGKLSSLGMAPPSGNATKLDVWTIPSMADAVKAIGKSERYWPTRGERHESSMAIPGRALNGEPQRLALAIEDSNALITDAIAADPRLARRSQWVRAEEGEVVCPALLSEGDDAPCFARQRRIESQPNGYDPVKIVISTDDSKIKERTAAAFIATVRLVQQYRPVEIWWQGSWLGADRRVGWVFHVPLVAGDMDFSRLEFCIADRARDLLSWDVMMARACEETHAIWNGCSLQAERSYLPGAQFVSHHGIDPDGESIACNAAQWLGWESFYSVRWDYNASIEGALQRLPPPVVAYVDKRSPAEMAKQKADSERWETERKEREQQAAKAREQGISLNY